MTIKAYLKPHCGWSNGVRAILRKHSLPFEDIDIISEIPSPEEVADEASTHDALKRGIAALSDREKTVVALYYDRELTLREIGAVLEVSESRVSQMLTAIAKKLRGLMNEDERSKPSPSASHPRVPQRKFIESAGKSAGDA